MLDERNIQVRVLAAVLEPVIASVAFAPEAHEALHALGFGPTGGLVTGDEWAEHHWGKCQMPDYTAYITGRGAHMGNPSGEVVAATFGIFKPAMVIDMWNAARAIASPAATCAARDSGGIAQLERLLGEHPEGIDRVNELLERAGAGLPLGGHPMYAGLLALGVPTQPVGRMLRLGDRLREYRGDSFTAAWSSRGLTGIQIQLLTEILAGFPLYSYTAARGYTAEEMNEALADLVALGYVSGEKATDAGRAAREEIELATDRACYRMVDNLGDDIVELVSIMRSYGLTVMDGLGHAPASPQEQVMDPSIQNWMDKHNLSRFAFGPA